MTLLELLLVVFILSAIALTAASLVDGADEQFRYEDTKTRLAILRTAVAGDPPGGAAGFVADYGRLPQSISELLEQGSLAPWTYDPAVRLSAGWRGPYLPVLPEGDGSRSFRDGWGNDWASFVANDAAGTLLVLSHGSDGVAGGSGYAADYPPSGPIVLAHDHQMDLRPWQVTVVFRNGSGAPEDPGVVRLRLYHPSEGGFAWPAAWPGTDAERDAAPWLSEEKAVGPVPAGGTASVVFRFDAAGVEKRVPWGERTLAVVADATGQPVAAGTPYRVLLGPRAPLPVVDALPWELP